MTAIDTKTLKDEALESLLSTLDTIRGRKCLVIDRSLSSTLSLVASFSELQEHGVEKMFWLQSPNLVSLITSFTDSTSLASTSSGPNNTSNTDNNNNTPSSVKYVTFLVPSYSAPKSINIVASTAQELLAKQGSTFDISLIQVPERSPDFVSILENAGVLGDITLHTWPVHFIPLAPDLISLNLPNSGGYKELYIDQIPSTVQATAAAVQDLQQRYGLIGRITGKGASTQDLVDLLLRKREERQTDLSETVSSTINPPTSEQLFDHQYANVFTGKSIEQLVAIDRQSDPVTPLLTQLTYEGLIEEFYGITESGQVELPANIVTPSSTTNQTKGNATDQNDLSNAASKNINDYDQHSTSIDHKKVTLGGENDQLFNHIRDANFSTVGQTLNKVARQLQSDYEQRHEAKTVNQIKEFVGKLGGLQSLHQVLRFHTALAEELMSTLQDTEFNKWLEIQQNIVADTLDLTLVHNMIEDLIDRSSSPQMVLRLLALDSLCNGGIKEKELTHLKHEFLQTYGYHYLDTFDKLQQIGILYPRHPSKPNWFPTARKQLGLISEQQDDLDPSDIAFTYSGYAPLSVRIVQASIDKDAVLQMSRNKRSSSNFGGSQSSTTSNLSTTTSANGVKVHWRALGWKGAEPILKNLPGPRVDEIQHDELFVREGKLRKILARNTGGLTATSVNKKATIVVLYIGGITYAEVAALRFLSQNSEYFDIIIATTGMLSGNKIIDAAIEN